MVRLDHALKIFGLAAVQLMLLGRAAIYMSFRGAGYRFQLQCELLSYECGDSFLSGLCPELYYAVTAIP